MSYSAMKNSNTGELELAPASTSAERENDDEFEREPDDEEESGFIPMDEPLSAGSSWSQGFQWFPKIDYWSQGFQ